MKGSAVFYRVPSSQGWRLLQGTIVNVTPYSILVRERFFGGLSTINHNWIVSYSWENKKAVAA